MHEGGFPLTADFLRGLAATVSGRPEGPNNYYMVAMLVRGKQKLVFGERTKVPKMFESRADADKEVGRLEENETLQAQAGKGTGAKFVTVGPFLSPEDPAEPHDVFVAGVLSRRGGVEGDTFVRYKVEKSMDMLCFSPSAFDKFVAPYYYSLYGSGDQAARRVQQLKADMIASASGIMGHRWPTSPGFIEAEFTALEVGENAGPQDEGYTKSDVDPV